MRRVAGNIALNTVVSVIALFLVLPTLVVIPMAFSSAEMLIFPPPGFSTQWFSAYLNSPTWRQATLNSFTIAIGATLLSSLIGTLGALALVRSRLPGAGIMRALFLLPIIVPSIVMAVGMYRMFSEVGLAGTLAGLVLAHTVLVLPFVFINVSAVLQKINWTTEQAARSLGAGASKTFLLVILPMLAPGVAAGALFAFLTSFDEVVVTLFLSGVRATTLPVQMWSGIRFEISPLVAAASVFLILLSIIVFGASMLLRRPRSGG